ncbi:hypothetical protein [Streptomyces rubiginosohelvolus]|uniref:hypothetical protein n=1 Tax=Streptomyces rubiginosohelvolus TaxID=67362 RepID=UPI0036E7684B
MATSHDMTTLGQGSNSRLNSAQYQQGSPENADRLLAERRSSSLADSYSHNDAIADHYAERNAQKERDAREARWDAERDRRVKALDDPIAKALRERDMRGGCGDPGYFYDEEDPRWGSRDEWEAEKQEWQASRDRFEAKLVGDDLATRIINSKFHY